MAEKSEWRVWLHLLKAAGKGPVTWRANRHTAFKQIVRIQGDWTGAAMRGDIRSSPDAVGSPLAVFTITGPTVADGYSTFTLNISKATMVALPADADADGQTRLVFDVLLDPAGSAADEVLFGGEFIVIGGVTQ